MALIVKKQHESGADVEYWNIQRVDWYPLDKVADVTINGYISEQARRDGLRPIALISLRVEHQKLGDITRADIYEALKSLHELNGAIDV